jgi:hypothetical protein
MPYEHFGRFGINREKKNKDGILLYGKGLPHQVTQTVQFGYWRKTIMTGELDSFKPFFYQYPFRVYIPYPTVEIFQLGILLNDISLKLIRSQLMELKG